MYDLALSVLSIQSILKRSNFDITIQSKAFE